MKIPKVGTMVGKDNMYQSSDLRCEVSQCLVAVQPTGARRFFEANKIIVQVLVLNIAVQLSKRVNSANDQIPQTIFTC